VDGSPASERATRGIDLAGDKALDPTRGIDLAVDSAMKEKDWQIVFHLDSTSFKPLPMSNLVDGISMSSVMFAFKVQAAIVQ
jgi:hypothetical protein